MFDYDVHLSFIAQAQMHSERFAEYAGYRTGSKKGGLYGAGVFEESFLTFTLQSGQLKFEPLDLAFVVFFGFWFLNSEQTKQQTKTDRMRNCRQFLGTVIQCIEDLETQKVCKIVMYIVYVCLFCM